MEHFTRIIKILMQITAISISLILVFAISFLTETNRSMSDQTFHRPISISDFLLACAGIVLIMLVSRLFEKKGNALQP